MTPTNAAHDSQTALRLALGPGFALSAPSDHVLQVATGARPHTGPHHQRH